MLHILVLSFIPAYTHVNLLSMSNILEILLLKKNMAGLKGHKSIHEICGMISRNTVMHGYICRYLYNRITAIFLECLKPNLKKATITIENRKRILH